MTVMNDIIGRGQIHNEFSETSHREFSPEIFKKTQKETCIFQHSNVFYT